MTTGMKTNVYYVCVKPKTYSLTRNKSYISISESEDLIRIENDDGIKANYSKKLFKRIEW